MHRSSNSKVVGSKVVGSKPMQPRQKKFSASALSGNYMIHLTREHFHISASCINYTATMN